MATTGASILPASLYPNAGTTKGVHTGTSKGGISFTSNTLQHDFCWPALESTTQAGRFYTAIAYSCLAAIPNHSPLTQLRQCPLSKGGVLSSAPSSNPSTTSPYT